MTTSLSRHRFLACALIIFSCRSSLARQCITLLADNAFKHGAAMGEVVVGVTLADLREERGHAAVERRSTEPSDGRTWFELSVADGGFVGPEVQERMFLPFEQETPEGGVKPSGIGLGAYCAHSTCLLAFHSVLALLGELSNLKHR